MEVKSTDRSNQVESKSCLRIKIEELKRISIQDKLRFDFLHSELELLKLTSSQEANKCKNEYMIQTETVARLESVKNALKESESSNQEMILSLFKKLHNNEREFSQKVLELKVQNSNLECCKRKVDDEVKELMKKCEDYEDLARNCNVKKMEDKEESGDELKKQKRLKSANCIKEDMIPLRKLFGRKKSAKLITRKPVSFNRCDFRIFESMQKSPTSKSKNKLLDSDKAIQTYIKRNMNSKRAYTRRIASSKQILQAQKRAEIIQIELNSENPSFVRPMVPSNVSGGFWLSLPANFKRNLPDDEIMMMLEDEAGLVFKVNYLGRKNGLSGGWRGFAEKHALEIGDILIFELTQPSKFKVKIIKALENETVVNWKRKPNSRRTKTPRPHKLSL